MWDAIYRYIISSFAIDRLDTPQGILTCVFSCISTFFAILLAYRFVYLLVGTFGKARTYKEAKKDKKYAFVIPARNEEKVIGNLIRSIRGQDYPQELITIYVIADNCDENDKTATIARELGCRVYERHDPSKQRKGYGLEFLFEQIRRDCGIESVDAYLLHDADNILSKDYLSKMNDAFSAGNDFCIGYLASKNFGENPISAAHSIDLLRCAVSCDRARNIFGVGTRAKGTGNLIKSSILKDGWHYLTLGEDSELSMDYIAKDGKITYVEEAVYYDEQPRNLCISFRQRMRWTKAGYQVFLKYGWRIARSNLRKPKWEKYDIWFDLFPYGLFMFLLGLTYNLASLGLLVGQAGSYSAKTFYLYLINSVASLVIQGWFTGILVCIRERKHIYCSKAKLIPYIFLWGFFDLFSIPISILCLFVRVKWKKIPHADPRTMEDFEKEKAKRLENQKRGK